MYFSVNIIYCSVRQRNLWGVYNLLYNNTEHAEGTKSGPISIQICLRILSWFSLISISKVESIFTFLMRKNRMILSFLLVWPQIAASFCLYVFIKKEIVSNDLPCLPN